MGGSAVLSARAAHRGPTFSQALKETMRFLPSAIVAAFALCVAASSAAASDTFFAPPADPGAKLPAEGIYPNGRKLAFMGYSGKPERDLAQGFNVAGPVYGNQEPYLAACYAKHWPVVAQVPTSVSFVSKDATKRSKEALQKAEEEAKAVVVRHAAHDEVIWWAINPEELRPWRKDEMDYLAKMAKIIRDNDPKKRPVYLYNPNHRDAGALAPIAAQVDIMGKGVYVNSCGKKDDRAWVRWSIEQEIKAAEKATKQAGHAVTPILMPELCKDPADPAEDAMIEPWVRHDVYLGLCSGAKGVLIWSLFPRKEVRRTWKTWYDAYARCGRELDQERHLGEVFLFGAPKGDLQVAPTDDQAAKAVALGGEDEPETTSAAERKARAEAVPDFTVCERALGAKRYLFVVNSRGTPRDFTAGGWPAGCRLTDAFTGQEVKAQDAAKFTLPAWGVRGIVAEGK